jgi:hypothetical protein
MDPDIEERGRSALDFVEFGVACAGFFIAAGGVTISSVPTTLFGLVLLAMGVGYFYVGQDESE